MLSVGRIRTQGDYNSGLQRSKKSDVSFGRANLSDVGKLNFVSNFMALSPTAAVEKLERSVALLPAVKVEIQPELILMNKGFRKLLKVLKFDKDIDVSAAVVKSFGIKSDSVSKMDEVKELFKKIVFDHTEVDKNESGNPYELFIKKITRKLDKDKSLQETPEVLPEKKIVKKAKTKVTRQEKNKSLSLEKRKAKLEQEQNALSEALSLKIDGKKLEIQEIVEELNANRNRLRTADAVMTKLKLSRARQIEQTPMYELQKQRKSYTDRIKYIDSHNGKSRFSMLEKRVATLSEKVEASKVPDKKMQNKLDRYTRLLKRAGAQSEVTSSSSLNVSLALAEFDRMHPEVASFSGVQNVWELNSQISQLADKRNILITRINAAEVRHKNIGRETKALERQLAQKQNRGSWKASNETSVNQERGVELEEKFGVQQERKSNVSSIPDANFEFDSTDASSIKEKADYSVRKATQKATKKEIESTPKKQKTRSAKGFANKSDAAKENDAAAKGYKMTPDQEVEFSSLKGTIINHNNNESALREKYNQCLFELCGGKKEDFGLHGVKRLSANIDRLYKLGQVAEHDKSRADGLIGKIIKYAKERNAEGPDKIGIYDMLEELSEKLPLAKGADKTRLNKQIKEITKQKLIIEAERDELMQKIRQAATAGRELRIKSDSLQYGVPIKSIFVI